MRHKILAFFRHNITSIWYCYIVCMSPEWTSFHGAFFFLFFENASRDILNATPLFPSPTYYWEIRLIKTQAFQDWYVIKQNTLTRNCLHSYNNFEIIKHGSSFTSKVTAICYYFKGVINSECALLQTKYGNFTFYFPKGTPPPLPSAWCWNSLILYIFWVTYHLPLFLPLENGYAPWNSSS